MAEKTKTGGGSGAGEEIVVVYSHRPRGGKDFTEHKARLSILMKTETGEVCGGGMNYAEGSTEPNNYTKLGLEGDVKKIVVGDKYCAALTHDGRLMVWEHTRFSQPTVCIGLKRYISGESCVSCTGGCKDMWGFAYCGRCGMFQPGREDQRVDIAISQRERTILCYECSEPHTTKTVKTCDQVGRKSINVTVAFCASCEGFFFGYHRQIMNMNYGENNSIITILRKNYERIKDVAFCGGSICLLSENNNLYIGDSDSNDDSDSDSDSDSDEIKMKLRTNEISSSVKMVAVYGGGGGGVAGQLFVKCKEGSLFECSDLFIMRGTCVLTDMKLPAAVEKVCCGLYCSAVLLNDGSVWFIKTGCTAQRLVHKSGLNVFTDIAVIATTNAYLVQASTGTTGDGALMTIQLSRYAYEVSVRFYESALNTVLKKMVPPTPRREDSSNVPARTLPLQNLSLPPPNLAQLYGKSHLADITIKLADEELSAHSVVLFAVSAHFQKTFNADNPPPKVLDVSHYNPQAYKYLLQYFYQIQPDDLDAEGFTHLRHIAASYGETQLADAASAKITSQLNEDNVERIFTLSKRYNFQDLAIECERIIRSPTFVEKLIQTAMKNLATSEDDDSWQLLTVSAPPEGKAKK